MFLPGASGANHTHCTTGEDICVSKWELGLESWSNLPSLHIKWTWIWKLNCVLGSETPKPCVAPASWPSGPYPPSEKTCALWAGAHLCACVILVCLTWLCAGPSDVYPFLFPQSINMLVVMSRSHGPLVGAAWSHPSAVYPDRGHVGRTQ